VDLRHGGWRPDAEIMVARLGGEAFGVAHGEADYA
jgi:hypothetical protein